MSVAPGTVERGERWLETCGLARQADVRFRPVRVGCDGATVGNRITVSDRVSDVDSERHREFRERFEPVGLHTSSSTTPVPSGRPQPYRNGPQSGSGGADSTVQLRVGIEVQPREPEDRRELRRGFQGPTVVTAVDRAPGRAPPSGIRRPEVGVI